MIAVYRISLSKAQLAALPRDERSLILIAGHALNQTTILLKLVTLSSNYQTDNAVDETVSAAQSHTLLRLLVGIVAESLVWLNRRDCQRLIGQVYLETLDHSAQASYLKIKSYFGRSSLLQRARNKFSSHFPSDEDLDQAFACTPEDQDWSLYMSESQSNSIWLPSELVMGFGMIGLAGVDDPMQGFKEIAEESVVVINALSDFLSSLILEIMSRHFGSQELPSDPVLMLTNAPKFQITSIPFFFEVSSDSV